ncbi:hypothetical protein CJF42_06065 [Pseudoalteromonas sp. NBT06-2]|uniref:D-alanyl-alanine synthetase n=1 Tax=Pseudoalteromonas sp. NBT06-2 TaxID=2025950 RepID=UPI000BA76A50|nr:D-alanyl-alanine synthetase [Pseudoalteromonas sp. NBT06-2]PAJ75213.1 hypothetical protein CJF42_06065 [Pseudoalteromonas sp. NBT06-2]
MQVSIQELSKLLNQVRQTPVAVIFSGDPQVSGNVQYRTNNPRNWKSYKTGAEDIARALKNIGFIQVRLLEENADLARKLKLYKINLAWLNSGGLQGHDSMCHAAAVCESQGVAYVGHRPLTTCILDYKPYFKNFCKVLGLKVPEAVLWNGEQFINHTLKKHTNIRSFLHHKGPFVIKPGTGRASNMVSIAYDSRMVLNLVKEVHDTTKDWVLVEEYLPGREFSVAVTGRLICSGLKDENIQLNRIEKPFCFAQFERKLQPGISIFTSIDREPISAQRIIKLDPNNDSDTLKELNSIACKLYTKLNLKGLIRIDLRQDEVGKLHVLEANPKPDIIHSIEKTSLLALGLSEVGISYDHFIVSQVANAVEHYLAQWGEQWLARLNAI